MFSTILAAIFGTMGCWTMLMIGLASSVMICLVDRSMGVEVSGKAVFIADVGGKYYALGNRCKHAGCMLSDGTLGEKM